jgi:hypothetical protein
MLVEEDDGRGKGKGKGKRKGEGEGEGKEKEKEKDSSTTQCEGNLTRRRSSGKVKKGEFSPRSLRLATGGHYSLRVSIATNDAFPPNHTEFTWSRISQSANASEDAGIMERFHELEKDLKLQADLIHYVNINFFILSMLIVSL